MKEVLPEAATSPLFVIWAGNGWRGSWLHRTFCIQDNAKSASAVGCGNQTSLRGLLGTVPLLIERGWIGC